MSIITNDEDLIVLKLQQGEVVSIPTETVYGLAADANNYCAIKKIYFMKSRPISYPLIVHVANNTKILDFLSNTPVYVNILVKRFWPGPLTLVINTNDFINKNINKLIIYNKTIAIRCPNHDITQRVLNRLNFPLVITSANLFGKISPTTAYHVKNNFKKDNLLILNGGRCSIGIESTIISSIHNNKYQILRHGSIDQKKIFNTLQYHANIVNAKKKYIQYTQTKKQYLLINKSIYFFETKYNLKKLLYYNNDKKIYILYFSKIRKYFTNIVCYKFPDCPKKTEFELYYRLNIVEQSDAEVIIIELPKNNKIWRSIRKKLLRITGLH